MAVETHDEEMSRNRFRGCLMGLATGDALGGPVEFATHYEIQKKHGVLREMVGGGWMNLAPGQGTDDTAQATALAESYVVRRQFDGLDFSRRLVAWLSGNPPDVGNQTRRVLDFIRENPTRWTDAGREIWYESGGSMAGNGSIMRCAPTALFRWNDVDLLVRETIQASQVTHFDPRCCEACVIVNFVIMQCLHGRYSPDLAHQALVFLRGARQTSAYQALAGHYEIARVRAHVPSGMEMSYLDDREAVDQALEALDTLTREDLKSTGYVVDTMQSALWIALRAESLEAGLVEAVNLGGDADTLGAVSGAILGARFGIMEIPARWGTRVADHGRIIQLADYLYERAPRDASITQF